MDLKLSHMGERQWVLWPVIALIAVLTLGAIDMKVVEAKPRP